MAKNLTVAGDSLKRFLALLKAMTVEQRQEFIRRFNAYEPRPKTHDHEETLP